MVIVLLMDTCLRMLVEVYWLAVFIGVVPFDQIEYFVKIFGLTEFLFFKLCVTCEPPPSTPPPPHKGIIPNICSGNFEDKSVMETIFKLRNTTVKEKYSLCHEYVFLCVSQLNISLNREYSKMGLMFSHLCAGFQSSRSSHVTIEP